MQGSRRSRLTGKLMSAAAIAALALGLGACSIIPDWADPTSWFGSDKPEAGNPPDLADIPDKSAANGDSQPLTDSLAADQKNAQYSGEALKGGESKAAPPPVPAPAAEALPVASAAAEAKTPAADEEKFVDRSVYAAPAGTASVPGSLPDTAAAPVTQPPPPVQTTPDQSSAGGKKTVETSTLDVLPEKPTPKKTHKAKVVAAVAPAIAPSDAALGFQPSSAPALDASVSDFVSAPIVNQFRTSSRKPHAAAPAKTASYVAPDADLTGAPAAVLFFPGDILTLNAKALAQVRTVAKEFNAGSGTLRVVGHAASRTADMPVKKHLALIMKKSQERAAAVVKALVRAGVPADKITVEAVGDSQPVYYESMPKGEEGNRRVEIFLQG